MIKRKRSWLALALVCSACSSPTKPSQPAPVPDLPPTAQIGQRDTLTVDQCVFDGTLYRCAFIGTGGNSGTGCAQHVRGTTTTFAPDDHVIGTATWSYPDLVRPGDGFTYRGTGLAILPVVAWTYETRFTWEDVPCS